MPYEYYYALQHIVVEILISRWMSVPRNPYDGD